MRKVTELTEVVIIITKIIILVLLPNSYEAVIPVDTCPENKQAWMQRSSIFVCEEPHEVYHCILSKNNILIETCMTAYPINSDKVGCPWVKIHNVKAYLNNPFKPCDQIQGSCPEKFHKRYSTNQLYKYPACITSDFKSAVPSTLLSVITTTNTDTIEERQNSLIIATPVFCVLVALVIIIFHLYQKRSKPLYILRRTLNT